MGQHYGSQHEDSAGDQESSEGCAIPVTHRISPFLTCQSSLSPPIVRLGISSRGSSSKGPLSDSIPVLNYHSVLATQHLRLPLNSAAVESFLTRLGLFD